MRARSTEGIDGQGCIIRQRRKTKDGIHGLPLAQGSTALSAELLPRRYLIATFRADEGCGCWLAEQAGTALSAELLPRRYLIATFRADEGCGCWLAEQAGTALGTELLPWRYRIATLGASSCRLGFHLLYEWRLAAQAGCLRADVRSATRRTHPMARSHLHMVLYSSKRSGWAKDLEEDDERKTTAKF